MLTPAQIQLVARIIGAAILILACWYAWSQFTGHYIEIGRQERQPEIDALVIDKKKLQDSYLQISDELTKQNAQISELKKLTEAKKQARAQADKKAKDIAEHREAIINASERREMALSCDLAVLEAQKDLQ
jgi:biopolymer transport protein ExbB/TolQ